MNGRRGSPSALADLMGRLNCNGEETSNLGMNNIDVGKICSYRVEGTSDYMYGHSLMKYPILPKVFIPKTFMDIHGHDFWS